MSTMAKDEPIPVDDQSLFFRQIVDSSPELLHTARPDGYLEVSEQFTSLLRTVDFRKEALKGSDIRPL